MLSEINSEEDIFNNRRKILKRKLLLEDEIDSLSKDQLSLSGKGDLSAALKLKDKIKGLKQELNSVNKEIEDFENVQDFFNYRQLFLDNLSFEDKSIFLNFNTEKSIPVIPPLVESFSAFSKINYNFSINEGSLKTSLSDSQSKSMIRKLFSNFEEDKNNMIYISLCYIKFKEYYAPLLFIPVILENPYDYKILRDYNHDILYNKILKNKLIQFGVNLPNFEAGIDNFISNLKNIDEITFCDDIFISNCNLGKILIDNDLKDDNWMNFSSKLNILSKTGGCYSFGEVKTINNDIVREHGDFSLKLKVSDLNSRPHFLIKNLLSKDNSLLYISDNSESIKKLLADSKLGPLILDLNNLDITSFRNQINQKLIKFSNINRADVFREKRTLNHLISILKTPFLNFGLLPIEIKERLDYYSRIQDSKIKISILNISKYTLNYFDEAIEKILYLINKSNEIPNFKEYFMDESLSSSDFQLVAGFLDNLDRYIDEFVSLNKRLNEKVKLRLFNNLELVGYLTNLNVLNKSYQYIEVEDRLILNELIKQYDKNVNKEYFDNIDKLANLINDLSILKPKLLQFNNDLNELIRFFNEINLENNNEQSFENLQLNLNESINNLNELKKYIDINNDFNEIKEEINYFDKKFGSIFSKYFESNEDIYETLENNIKFTELIDYRIIEDESLIKASLSYVYGDIEDLYQLYKNIQNQINNVYDFSQKHTNLKFPKELFCKNTSFDDLKSLIHSIKLDLESYNSFNNTNYPQIVVYFVNQYLNGNIEKEELSNVLYYNVYNGIYNEFLNRHPEFSNNNLDYRDYEHKLQELDNAYGKYKYNKIMYEIYKTPYALVEKTKDEKLSLNKRIDDNELKNIEFALTKFKNCIMATKRIFIADTNSVVRYLSNSYENTFDYVILENSKNISDFELLSLLLRSKNKIIKLE